MSLRFIPTTPFDSFLIETSSYDFINENDVL
jgi:hypothetical protein